MDLKGHLSHFRDEEHSVRQEPNTAGVHDHFADGHFGGADGELPAGARVILTAQRDGVAVNISEGFTLHRERDRKVGGQIKPSTGCEKRKELA